ncbi:site-specific DNA-methyltransferase [Salmonella enterica]|nr:site-specific DNA-methyltransferase [Salmonella enterica]
MLAVTPPFTWRLHHGDCLNILPTLQPGGVDLILCDPPYGTIKGAGLNSCFGIGLNARKAPVSYFEDVLVFSKVEKYDPKFDHPLREYARRVTTFAGVTATQVNKALGHRKAEHFLEHDATQFGIPTCDTYNQLIATYNLTAMPGFLTYEEMKAMHENWRNNRQLLPRVFNLPPGKRHKSNILEYARDREKYHPTQKPVALLEDLIQTYSTPGDTVLDFTMGSGSTGVACLNTGRRFIGIEKDKKYFDIAVNRIEQSPVVN